MILDGRSTSNKLFEELKVKFDSIDKKIELDIIQLGDSEDSKRYIRQKEKMAEKLGVECNTHWLDINTSEEELLNLIDELNNNDDVYGIIVQLPLPKHIDVDKVRNRIDANKDVDGMNNYNLGLLFNDEKTLYPCTAYGIIKLLDNYNIDLDGKDVCIIGRSIHIGKSLYLMMCNRNATVTLCHSHTKNLEKHLKEADIIVCALGKSNYIKSNMIKDDSIIIDVGFNVIDDKINGDVDYNDCKDKCSYITPVPGGVGPMTVISIFLNLLECFYCKNK